MGRGSRSLDLPGEGEVYVFYIDLAVSADEAGRLRGFVHPDESGRGKERIVAWGRAREILASYLRCNPEDLRVVRPPSGKPSLLGADLSFSLSYAHDKAALAVTTRLPIGVDIEFLDRAIDPLAIARRFFTQEEVEAILDLSDRREGFFRAWVRKEAYLKGVGGSVPADLSRFSVSIESDLPRIIASDLSRRHFSLVDLAPPSGYIAAIALGGEIKKIEVFGNSTPGGT